MSSGKHCGTPAGRDDASKSEDRYISSLGIASKGVPGIESVLQC
jgi:hypothetical protein